METLYAAFNNQGRLQALENRETAIACDAKNTPIEVDGEMARRLQVLLDTENAPTRREIGLMLMFQI